MKTTLLRILSAGLLLLPGAALLAQTSMVPSAMNYQGFLTDNDGNPVANSIPENRNLEFRIYGHPTASAPLLWGEAQTVTIYKGNFSVILGNGSAISGVPASGADSLAGIFANATTSELYFGIQPQGGAEYAPRQKLLASAYALRARTAERVIQNTGTSTLSIVNFAAGNVSGTLSLTGMGNGFTNFLELGAGVANKQADAGKFLYQAYSDGLDIVGAGTTNTNRKLTLWAEGGTEFKGGISFGQRLGQHIHLHGTSYGIGIQTDSLYLRTGNNFRWFAGGVHADGNSSAGTGGTQLAVLNSTGFTLNNGVFTGNGSGLTNLPMPSAVNSLGVNGNNVIEFGRGVANKPNLNGLIWYSTDNNVHQLNISGGGTAANFGDRKIVLHAQGGGLEVIGDVRPTLGHKVDMGNSHGQWVQSWGGGNAIGSQDWTTYFRTPRNFAWYLGGSHSGTELNPGTGGTLRAFINTQGVHIPVESLRFGSRLGQHINLYDTTFGIGINPSTLYSRSTDQFDWYVGGSHSDTGGPGTGGQHIARWNNTKALFYRPIEITGSQDIFTQYAFFTRSGGTGFVGGGPAAQTIPISVYAHHRMLAQEYAATSDARLKNVSGRSDGTADLDTLRRIEIVDYTMKDPLAGGGRSFKKVVAQQVEKVYPQVVLKNPGVVPDVQIQAQARSGFIPISDISSFKFQPGETLRLLQENEDFETEIVSVEDNGIRVARSVDGGVFVYGRRVTDLLTVDYEAIAMLNVSATQELARQISAQAAELSRLKAQRDSLAAELKQARKALESQDARLAAIEARLDGAPAALPVKAKTTASVR